MDTVDYGLFVDGAGGAVGYASASGGQPNKRLKPEQYGKIDHLAKFKSPPLSPTDHAAGGLLVGFIESIRRQSLEMPSM